MKLKYLLAPVALCATLTSAAQSTNDVSDKIDLYFINPKAAAETISYEHDSYGNDRTRLQDIKIYDNKIFSVYGGWENHPNHVFICAYDMLANESDCSYTFGGHGIAQINEIHDKLYFMADDSAEGSHAPMSYQALAIYDKNDGWTSVSALNFRDLNGGHIWYGHSLFIAGSTTPGTLYSKYSSGNGQSTEGIIFKSTDGGINWQAQEHTKVGVPATFNGALHLLDFRAVNYLFDSPKIKENVNDVYHYDSGNEFVTVENAPYIFPEYIDAYNFLDVLVKGDRYNIGAIQFKDKLIIKNKIRQRINKRIYHEEALFVTDLTRDVTFDDQIYTTGKYILCPNGISYLCFFNKLIDIEATDNWLYVLLANGESRRTSDLENWEIITSDEDFAEGVVTASIEADDEYVYIGADKGRVFRVKLPEAEQPQESDPFIIKAKQWTSFSIPGDPQTPVTLADAFAEHLDIANYGRTWLVQAQYHQSSGYYVLPASAKISPGTSYWLYFNNGAASIPFNFKSQQQAAGVQSDFCASDKGCVIVDIPSNRASSSVMIGNPLPYDIKWADVRILVNNTDVYTPAEAQKARIVADYFASYDSDNASFIWETSADNTALNAYKGYWIWIHTAHDNQDHLQLLFPK